MKDIKTTGDLRKWLVEHSEGANYNNGRATYYMGDAADYVRVTVGQDTDTWAEVEVFTMGARVSEVPAVIKAIHAALGLSGGDQAPFPFLDKWAVIKACTDASVQAVAEGGPDYHINCRVRELVAGKLSELFADAARKWAEREKVSGS